MSGGDLDPWAGSYCTSDMGIFSSGMCASLFMCFAQMLMVAADCFFYAFLDNYLNIFPLTLMMLKNVLLSAR